MQTGHGRKGIGPGIAVLLGLVLVIVSALMGNMAGAERGSRHGNTTGARLTLDVSDNPVVPRIDAMLKARLRAVLAAGQASGNRPGVFAKIGDSISESGSFLQDLGCGGEELGDHGDLAPTIQFLRATEFPPDYTSVWCGEANSFSRASVTAVSGWSADYALATFDAPMADCPAPFNLPLLCELHLIKPGIALIMYGTNDLARYNDLDSYRANLTQIVNQTLAAGVIPVLSTIPPRFDEDEYAPRVATHNQVVIEVAAAAQVPVWNYWLALQEPSMVNFGMDEDAIHPNVYECPPCVSADFRPEAIRYGYNMRNLTAIQVLDKLKRVVLDDGPADTGGPQPSTTSTPPSGATATATPRSSSTPTNGPAVTATSTPAVANCGDGFTDVVTDDYFYAGVRYLLTAGAISGYGDCTFRPYNNTSRGQLTKIVVVAEQFSLVSPSEPTFSDVPASNPFFPFIETAAARNIVSGYSDGTFKWAAEVTRGQLAKIVVSAASWEPLNPSIPSFGDVPVGSPFYGFVEAAGSRGIISGYSTPEGTVFRPSNPSTRGQIAKIVHLSVTVDDTP